MTTSLLTDRITEMLLGVAVGDALGAPVETMSAAEIAEAFPDGVQGMVPVTQWRLSDTQQLKPWQTTDDWQLTQAVAEGLIGARGFDLRAQALAHVQARRESVFGWGKTSERAVARLEKWSVDPTQPLPRPQGNPRANLSTQGNGVAIKVAPLAAWHALRASRPQWLMEDVLALGTLTHSGNEARWTPVALALALFRRLCDEHEDDLRPELLALSELLRDFDELRSSPTVTLLDQLCACNGDTRAMRERIGTGFAARESVVYALGVGLRYGRDLPAGLLCAVNDGGDTDSTAGMVGALCGAAGGVVPAVWHRRELSDRAAQLAHALADAAA